MGFEVLDVGGRPSESPDVLPTGRADRIQPLELEPRPPEPLALDPLDPHDPHDPHDPQDPHDPVPAPAARRHPRLPAGTWWKVAAAGVVGIAIGAVATQHHATDVAQAREARRVIAQAQFSDVTPNRTDRGTVAEVRVRVTNLGSRPFDVVVATSGGAPTAQEAAQFRTVSGTATVQPNQVESFSTAVLLDCQSSAPISLSLPVRSAAGTTSRLPVQPAGDSGPLSGLELCPFYGPDAGFQATIGGTLSRPTMRLSNDTAEPITVTLDSGSPLTEATSQRLSLTTVPALPLKVPGHSNRTVRLQLRAHGCLAGADATTMDGISYLQLRADDVRGNEVGASGVDVGALVGLAMARSCS
ncbi:hypothetical protein [Angustibacter luteus]|uniref:DUF4232 domain-containing protein n=1 Tax=Angustibacter luteus TaxID=658456 RepID=A0ABW1JDY4_9ACTN